MTPRSIERTLVLAGVVVALFCARAPVLGSAQEREAEDSSAAKTAQDPEVPVCDGPLKLGATFYVNDRPDQSLAMLRTPKTPTAGLYRRGMYVEGYQVIAVEPRGVLLARDNAYCWLRLQPDPTRPAPTPPPPPPPRPKRKR